MFLCVGAHIHANDLYREAEGIPPFPPPPFSFGGDISPFARPAGIGKYSEAAMTPRLVKQRGIIWLE